MATIEYRVYDEENLETSKLFQDTQTAEITQFLEGYAASDGYTVISTSVPDPVGTDTVASNPVGDAVAPANSLFPIWGEESGGSSNNARQFSYGNGATGNIGIILPVDCTLEYLTFHADVFGTSISIEVMKDNTAVTSQLFTGERGHVKIEPPIDFVAGEMIGFRTDVETGSYSDTRACAWMREK